MLESMIATAPGKLILTGEYAVLDGAPAIVLAVNRRVVARAVPGTRSTSPFLVAVAEEVARRYGDPTDAARAIVVDSSSFYEGDCKLGLGSSAAVTVAATMLALAVTRPEGAVRVNTTREIREIATLAHANAQGAMGARGSGADIASAVSGGAIVFAMGEPPSITKRTWPHSVRIVPFFTGVAANTAKLVSTVAAARIANPAAVDAALIAIADASKAAGAALTLDGARSDLATTALLAAVSLAAHATDRLAAATGVALVPPCVLAAREAMKAFGGTAKTTGAGGGDIGVAVIPATADVTAVRRSLIEAGCRVLELSVDERGVDLRPPAQ